MNHLEETQTIAAAADRVWPLLSDPSLVASCIPGAALTDSGDDGIYRGTIRVKFGPTVVNFRGEATLAYDHAARRCTIEGRGVDQRGASRAVANGEISIAPAGVAAATLSVTGDFHMTGPLQGFADTGGVHVARALLGEFAANIARAAGEQGAAGAALVQPTAPAAELNGLRLLWRAFIGWFRGAADRREARDGG